MLVLITGGAGYIGAHVVRALADEGMTPVVVDNLSSGQAGFVPAGVAFVQGDILDTGLLARVLTEHGCAGVVHVAGFKYAGVSVEQPLHTYAQNVTGTGSVLAAMEAAGVSKIVFSSSAIFTDLTWSRRTCSMNCEYCTSRALPVPGLKLLNTSISTTATSAHSRRFLTRSFIGFSGTPMGSCYFITASLPCASA